MNNVELVKHVYASIKERQEQGRKWFGRPLTLAEKILCAHLETMSAEVPQRMKTTVDLKPDRVAMQDATAQMAVLQFMRSGMKTTAVPSTVHCDHLIRARVGAADDLPVALNENAEVYEFLRTAAKKYGMGFWRPGSGIIHQVVLENYAFPGGMMIGTDSHTPNAGGLGMIAIGVGGADAVDVMVDQPLGLLWPGAIGVKLTGELTGWAAPKDVILHLMGILTVKGGTNSIVEFFGPGAESISCTGKATICNMGAEHGATTSVFLYDERMGDFLRATDRTEIAELAANHADCLAADPEVYANPEKFYDQVIEIDLSKLEPMIAGPHTPDLVRPISQMAKDIKENDYPQDLSFGLIGSCTNASYQDMGRSANLAKQAKELGLKAATGFMITPGSDKVHHTMERDGQQATLESIGGKVLANACGPCIGQWTREDTAAGTRNAIITSYNRNFRKRADGNADTLAFIASPETVTALVLAGRLDFNPLTDKLTNDKGEKVKLSPPTAEELPSYGFSSGDSGFDAPAADGDSVEVAIGNDSQRLQALEAFSAWDGKNFEGLRLLLHASGKCTTDHISPAGPWLRFRGHLDNISDNMFSGAVNKYAEEPGFGINQLNGETLELNKIARDYKSKNIGWIAVGDTNYGEGSSREHAAMSPRFLGCKAVLVRSFARIHETNLKKQGVLPLTFVNPDDYDKFRADDVIAVRGLIDLAPEQNLTVDLTHADGSSDSFEVKHSLTPKQIDWFKAGSTLNWIAANQ